MKSVIYEVEMKTVIYGVDCRIRNFINRKANTVNPPFILVRDELIYNTRILALWGLQAALLGAQGQTDIITDKSVKYMGFYKGPG